MSETVIVDFHTHIFPPSFRAQRDRYAQRDGTFATLFSNPRSKMATVEELISAMDESQVDVAVAMGVGWTDRDLATEANDYIVHAAKSFPERIVGFCSVNPAWGEEAVREVERCARKGVRGIGELHPDTQGFDIADEGVMTPIMRAAQEMGLIVLTHSSEPVGHLYPGKGKTTPDKLCSFIGNFPESTVVCAHWGGGLPFYTLMPEVRDVLSNVYFDTAASPFLYRRDIFPAVVGLTGPEKVLFGTDFPLIQHERLLEQVRGTALAEDAKARIMGGNAKGLLRL